MINGNDFFNGCKNEGEVKALYYKLAKKHHPDLGGDAEVFKALNNAYEFAIKGVWANEKDSEWKTRENVPDWLAMAQEIIRMAEVQVEIMGSWLWATGAGTKTHKAWFSENNWSWSNPKRAWYWKPYASKGKVRGAYSLNQIRTIWGSEVVGAGKAPRKADPLTQVE